MGKSSKSMGGRNNRTPNKSSTAKKSGKPLEMEHSAPEFVKYAASLVQKQRQSVYDQVSSNSLRPSNCSNFIENKDKNRVMVPILNKKRVKTHKGEGDYVPASYAPCERDEFIIWQAPTKENYMDFWRCAWKDGTKVIVSVSDKMSDSDPNLCYPYFPTSNGTTMDIPGAGANLSVKCLSSAPSTGFVAYELQLSSSEGGEQQKDSKKGSEDENDEDASKPRVINLFQLTNWHEDTWPELPVLGQFVKAVSNQELKNLHKVTSAYTAPIIIQGHAGTGRLRPSAFNKKVHVFATFALAFQLAGIYGWIAPKEYETRVKEVLDGFNKH